MHESPSTLESPTLAPLHHKLLNERMHADVRDFPPHIQREKVFQHIIMDRLLDTYETDLEDADLTSEEIDRFVGTIEQFSNEAIMAVLSLPKELRPKLFSTYRKKIDEDEVSPEEIAASLRDLCVSFGFTLGYHVSMKDIPQQENKAWAIQPTELDDRDDMKMAYYSLDFDNIYRKKPARYLYFVRAEIGEHSAHKRDQNNNWGRAPYLSIVEKEDLREVDTLVEETLAELQKENPPT